MSGFIAARSSGRSRGLIVRERRAIDDACGAAVMSIVMSSCAQVRSRALRAALAARACAVAASRRQGVDAGVAHRAGGAVQLHADRRGGLRAGDRRGVGEDGVGVRGSGVIRID